jgi:hypothetical protein
MADTGQNDPRKLLAAMQPPPKPARAARTPRVKPHAPRKARSTLPPIVPWLALHAAGLAAISGAVWLTLRAVETHLQAEAQPTTIAAELALSDSPDFLEILSEQALALPQPDDAVAYLAAKRATDIDPTRAFAWARLAYLEARRDSGKVNPEALAALTRSMDACPLCDTQLIGWRFNFVLTHWNDVPDETRRRAFEQADLLRWIGQNAEFLAEMRFKAQLKGIPFDAYRSAVDTPARSWDIAPSVHLHPEQAAE